MRRERLSEPFYVFVMALMLVFSLLVYASDAFLWPGRWLIRSELATRIAWWLEILAGFTSLLAFLMLETVDLVVLGLMVAGLLFVCSAWSLRRWRETLLIPAEEDAQGNTHPDGVRMALWGFCSSGSFVSALVLAGVFVLGR